jgi:hypothetical protein
MPTRRRRVDAVRPLRRVSDSCRREPRVAVRRGRLRVTSGVSLRGAYSPALPSVSVELLSPPNGFSH